MFLKISQLLSRKLLCWSIFVIKLQAYRPTFLLKKGLQYRCFLKKFLRTAFFVEHLTIHYTFSKFYVMIDFLDVFGYKIDIFHISCAIALISSMVHAYSVLVFTPKFLVSVSFARITTSAPALLNWIAKIQKQLSNWIWVFEHYALLLFLFRSGLAGHGLK